MYNALQGCASGGAMQPRVALRGGAAELTPGFVLYPLRGRALLFITIGEVTVGWRRFSDFEVPEGRWEASVVKTLSRP